MKRMRFPLTAMLLALLTSVVTAHDTWLIPDRFIVSPDEKVSFALTSGTKFTALEFGPKPERIAKAGPRIGGESGELKEFTAGEKALRLTTSFAKEGVATIWLQAYPKHSS